MAQEPETTTKRAELPMRLTRLRVKNFRSIADIDISLSPLTVLVGPNGSGKSNVVDALRFVRDVFAHGLIQAVMDREGMGVIQRWGTDRDGITIGVAVESSTEPLSKVDYEFTFTQLSDGTIGVVNEQLNVNSALENPIKITKNKQGLTVEANGPELNSGERVFPQAHAFRMNFQKPKGLFSKFGFSWIYEGLKENFEEKSKNYQLWKLAIDSVEEDLWGLLFYDISPADVYVLTPQQVKRKFPLDERGHNLAAVLGRLSTSDNAYWHALLFALRQTITGFDTLEVDEIGGYLATKLIYQANSQQPRTSYLGQESGGTIRMLGILAALLQEPSPPFISIEEPEANIHPGALAVLAGVLDEASLRSQILVTTHSPDMLDHLPVESFLVVEKVGDTTHVGPLDASQIASVRKRLFTPGELFRMEGLQRQTEPTS